MSSNTTMPPSSSRDIETTPAPPARPLTADDGPLVWIDLEMTGLDPKKDEIMEIAVIITDGQLTPVDDGVEFIAHVGDERLNSMDEWCIKQHGESGLTEACRNSPYSISAVEKAVLSYVQARIPEQKSGVLAGNSVHVDRQFLLAYMPTLVDWLHYRIVDVSSIKELRQRWYQNIEPPRAVPSKDAHRALADIRGSIKELSWYRENIFVKSVDSTL